RGAGGVTTLVVADAEAIALLPNVATAAPAHSGGVTVRYRGVDLSISAEATTADFARVRSWPVAEGTFLSPQDVDTYAPVAVLGQTVARAVRARREPAG
ncbi:MAG: ABC transporter permease, partial [Planctomycetes bacterium]|nr:ABC transporter permease [Planctomycetota bacterium]